MTDHDSIKRYPLEWPMGWKRSTSRVRAPFSMKDGSMTRDLNVEGATKRLENELDRLSAKDPVLSTNVSLNLRGIPRGDERPFSSSSESMGSR
jgi:hypothetical protein